MNWEMGVKIQGMVYSCTVYPRLFENRRIYERSVVRDHKIFDYCDVVMCMRSMFS